MSRTNKTNPYYVTVNRKGLYSEADHSHERFGEPVYRREYVLDKKGNVIIDDVPIYQAARFAVRFVNKLLVTEEEINAFGKNSSLVYIKGFMPVRRYAINPSYQAAFDLVAAGRGDEKVIVRYSKEKRTRRVLVGYVKDYCTVNEEWDGEYWGINPCHKGMGMDYRWPGSHTSWDKTARDAQRGGLRGRTKTSGRRLANAYNSGFDLYEDEWVRDDLNMTEVDRYNLW